MTIDWGIILESIPLLAEGVIVTLQVSALSAVLGLALGVALGLGAVLSVGPLPPMSISFVAHRFSSKSFWFSLPCL